MRSILTVTTPATVTKLTTLERVKQELSITDGSKDAILNAKIDEASSDIEAHLGFSVRHETVTETFWQGPQYENLEYLLLDRVPVGTITSVTKDDEAVASTLWRLDSDTGLLFSIDDSGYPSCWYITKSLVIVYEGGYLLPGEDGRNLPFAIEAAVVDLVQSFWFAKGRDALVKEEEVTGVGRVAYWVGAVGEAGELPPSVTAKLAPFRRLLA